MLRISNIKLPLSAGIAELKHYCARKLRISPDDIYGLEIVKKSVDAREKDNIHHIFSVDVTLKNGDIKAAIENMQNVAYSEKYKYELPQNNYTSKNRPVVIGFGPAGMFAGLILAQAGLCPIIYERGADADERRKYVDIFQSGGDLNFETNVQFGEGGAGTFSDGKLTTGIKDSRRLKVLEEMVRAGAPKEIKYLAKPHIGTDLLPEVVKNIRREIIRLGGEVNFKCKLEKLLISGNTVFGAVIKNSDSGLKEIKTENMVLAIGHSARDTVKMLYDHGVEMIQKPFSVGVRIEHPQTLINRSQYGKFAENRYLGAADYKLACHLPNGRGVYTFCMCPGGSVIAAASGPCEVVTNGMSTFARDGVNANSALLVGIDPDDFAGSSPLSGFEFQKAIERKAFELGGGNYFAPCQTLDKFTNGQSVKNNISVEPTYRPGVKEVNLKDVFPGFVTESLKLAVLELDKRLRGFNSSGALLTAPETRSSSPVRIPRNEKLVCNINGLYPAGEGAGYAGGIMSAAVDGIKCAENIIGGGYM